MMGQIFARPSFPRGNAGQDEGLCREIDRDVEVMRERHSDMQ